jgi:hypothetical protein
MVSLGDDVVSAEDPLAVDGGAGGAATDAPAGALADAGATGGLAGPVAPAPPQATRHTASPERTNATRRADPLCLLMKQEEHALVAPP